MKLNIGCGKSQIDGFDGVDAIDHGQKFVRDIREGFLIGDGSVDEIISSHFVEHLTGAERINFFNEIYRILKVGAIAKIITPDFSHASAYGDPTHAWPPMSEWYAFYLNEDWRSRFAPHVPYKCNFDYHIEKITQTLDGFSLLSLAVTLKKIG